MFVFDFAIGGDALFFFACCFEVGIWLCYVLDVLVLILLGGDIRYKNKYGKMVLQGDSKLSSSTGKSG